MCPESGLEHHMRLLVLHWGLDQKNASRIWYLVLDDGGKKCPATDSRQALDDIRPVG